MATIAEHLSVDALWERYVSSSNARLARHFQTIYPLAKGHSVAEVSRMTSFGPRWIEQLAARYNAEGPDSLGDLRRRNGTSATILKPELLDKLRERLRWASSPTITDLSEFCPLTCQCLCKSLRLPNMGG